MYAPKPAIIFIPVGTGDNGAHRRARPDFRRHRAIRTEPHRPPQPIPERDVERLRRLAEQFRDAVRVQHEAVLAAGRAMLQTLRLQAAFS
jgi:hypothetical protein